MAKTVVTKLDGKPALVVLPVGEKANFDRLRANTWAIEAGAVGYFLKDVPTRSCSGRSGRSRGARGTWRPW
jgi:hypothetical protein